MIGGYTTGLELGLDHAQEEDEKGEHQQVLLHQHDLGMREATHARVFDD